MVIRFTQNLNDLKFNCLIPLFRYLSYRVLTYIIAVMYKSIVILGRQPKLGIAELESLYGAENIEPFADNACFINKHHSEIDFTRLGGSVRLCKVIVEIPNEWQGIENHLLQNAPQHTDYINGKLSFGISVFGIKVSPKKIAGTALQLKKAIKQTGKSVRMVPQKESILGTATVLYNKLTGPNGWELCIISDGKKTILAQTTAIQDIDAYAARDQARPMRDAKVGMLPPKLAQIIINLAVGKLELGAESSDLRSDSRQKDDISKFPDPSSKILILDPFCGTGVLLQEATLMDYDVYGTDIEPRMIQYSIDNLNWLDEKFPDAGDYRRIEIGDATKHKWDFSNIEDRRSNISVACETYLGQPLSSLPPSDRLSKIMQEANEINHKFLANIAPQLKSGSRLCVAVPTWRGKREFLHLSALDYLSDLGYNRLRFKHVSNEDLIYHRENQVVGRELLVLIKK